MDLHYDVADPSWVFENFAGTDQGIVFRALNVHFHELTFAHAGCFK